MAYSLIKIKTATPEKTGQPPSTTDLDPRELAFDGDKTLYIKRPSDGSVVKVSGGIPDGGTAGQMLTPDGWVDPPSDEWADIQNKPSTFPPSSHSHLAADLPATMPPSAHTHTAADLPATMPPSSHTHPWAQVTGTPTTLSGYGITDGTSLTSTAASNLGSTAAAGTATTAARADHVHPYPTAAQVGAAPTSHSHTTGDVTGIDKLPLKIGTANLSGSTLTLDRNTGTIFTHTATANLTVALANPASGGETLYILRLTNGGAHTITWPTGATWVGGAEPALAASGTDEIHMLRSTNGSSVRMVALLANYQTGNSSVIPDTGVTAGTYTAGEITVNSEGRITYATEGTTGVTPGSYTAPTIMVDAYGRITEATNGSALTDTGVTAGTYIAGSLTVDIKGRITSATDGPTVTAGTYTNTNLTVDAHGRITAIENGEAGTGGGTVQNVGIGWVMVEEKTLTSAATSITFSGLDGNSDIEYELRGVIISNGTNAYGMLRFNGDATAANYKAQQLQSNTATAPSQVSVWSGVFLGGGSSSGQYGVFTASVNAKTGMSRSGIVNGSQSSSPSSMNYQNSIVYEWNNTTDNITSITIAADNSVGSPVANGLAVGTRIALYARRAIGAANYSTTETATGQRWIDGKMIYRKVVDFGALPNTANGTKSVAHSISGSFFVVSFDGISTNGTIRVRLPHISSTSTNNLTLIIDGSNVSITSQAASWSGYNTTYVVMEYAK